MFDAQADRVWRGIDDGTMQDVSEKWIDPSVRGRGLGLVVGQIDERPGLDVYVANDMTVNHLWSGERDASEFEMRELGSIRGLGVNGKSQSQASMGIAFADADDDGDFDLYLTHFAKEHHTYYEQRRPGFWVDRSFQTGLAQPSIEMLGFGTQWCDFDNDGAKELIVTNGHIDDFHQTGVAYRMPGQVFRRTPAGKWEDCDRGSLGSYFQIDHLGRALAIADLNRDGRSDVLITHLYEPVAMLINHTEGSGKSIRCTLKSTRTHRDAIGAVVSITVGQRTYRSMVSAGDGYMSSNERTVSFGVGASDRVESVSVHWPSGGMQTYENLHSGAEYLVVEGEPAFRYADDGGK
ncbi:ASPIC/UnbV domain-containing protein [Rhodopirellula maiorica SM1]|uniref:ASPIC/UnbV domain-containing protein n=2 Tax=Novipirellula TaxID=2795426 RepID=M5RH44_9BACT|nr:ASPIC/UnbV domain-containing protein [Rhodopirellula maiorica SM1]